MTQADYDLIVIGAGSAGYNGAAAATRAGLRVALIDGAQELGGLCILRGCMPSKALLAGGNLFRAIREAGEFGIRAGEISIDVQALVDRKNKLIAEFADYRRGQIENGAFTFIRGRASFLDACRVEVDTGNGSKQIVKGRSFLLATGSRIKVPELPGLAEIGCLDSDAALNLTTLPKSIIILGAGAIGLEFAHYFSSLGTKVTVLQRSGQMLRGSDADVAECLRASLEAHGVTVHTGVSLLEARASETGKQVRFSVHGESREVEAEEIFQALGRTPNLGGMNLEAMGVSLTENRLHVSSTQQTSVPHIFAAGDVCGPYEIVHLAIQQAEVAVRNIVRLLQGDSAPLEVTDYRLKLFVLFTQPEVAQVGLTECEARAAGEEIGVASYPFNDHGKSLVMGETEGFVKLITRKPTGEILGAAVIGPEAASLIHEIAVAMHFHSTARDLAGIPHYHPTLSEIWTYPAEELS